MQKNTRKSIIKIIRLFAEEIARSRKKSGMPKRLDSTQPSYIMLAATNSVRTLLRRHTFLIQSTNCVNQTISSIFILLVQTKMIPEPMSANNGDDIDIPSMFVGEATGKIILYNYLYKEGFALILNGDSPFNINTHLLVPFCAVVGLCFIIMVGLMITKCIREQRRLRRHRLPGSVLKKIPIIRFSSKEENCSRFETCAICIEDYVDGDRLRVLPCAHGRRIDYIFKKIPLFIEKKKREFGLISIFLTISSIPQQMY